VTWGTGAACSGARTERMNPEAGAWPKVAHSRCIFAALLPQPPAVGQMNRPVPGQLAGVLMDGLAAGDSVICVISAPEPGQGER